jgi:hypothetical protein
MSFRSKKDKTVDNKTGAPRQGHAREHASAPGDVRPDGQHDSYWVLSPEERAKGFIRPVRTTYRHNTCGSTTTMGTALAETYARDPSFYGATFCVSCSAHFPVGEFVWKGTDEEVGS